MQLAKTSVKLYSRLRGDSNANHIGRIIRQTLSLRRILQNIYITNIFYGILLITDSFLFFPFFLFFFFLVFNRIEIYAHSYPRGMSIYAGIEIFREYHRVFSRDVAPFIFVENRGTDG